MAIGKNPSISQPDRIARDEDSITVESGAHQVGSRVGAAKMGSKSSSRGGTAGVAGTGKNTSAYARDDVAEEIDSTVESSYWENVYETRPYFDDLYSFDDYHAAYRAGWETTAAGDEDCWETQEAEAKQRWEQSWENEGGSPKMTWEEARLAAHDAYERAACTRARNCASRKAH